MAVVAREFNQFTCTTAPCKSDFEPDWDVDTNDLKTFASFFGRDDCLGCPSGFILDMANSGDEPFVETNSLTVDLPEIPANDFTCRQEESCDAENCSFTGECRIVDGKAVCVCRPGYGGEDCSQCAVGYERDFIGRCVLGNTCREEYCYGKGDCAVERNSSDIVCQCDDGFSGPACGGPRIIISSPENSIYQGK